MSYRGINHKIMYTPGTGRQSGRSKNKYRLSRCEKQYSRNIPPLPLHPFRCTLGFTPRLFAIYLSAQSTHAFYVKRPQNWNVSDLNARPQKENAKFRPQKALKKKHIYSN